LAVANLLNVKSNNGFLNTSIVILKAKTIPLYGLITKYPLVKWNQVLTDKDLRGSSTMLKLYVLG